MSAAWARLCAGARTHQPAAPASATKPLLDKPVYNEGDERVGEVNDILIAPDKSMAYAIIGVGRFLGIGERQVAVPFMSLPLSLPVALAH